MEFGNRSKKIMFLAEKINQESEAEEEKNVPDIIEALNNDILILDNDYNHKIDEWLLHIDTQNYSHPKNYCGNFSGTHVNCINDSLIENDVSIINETTFYWKIILRLITTKSRRLKIFLQSKYYYKYKTTRNSKAMFKVG